MQQRSMSSLRVADDQCITSQIPELQGIGKHSPRRRSMDDSDNTLPIYFPHSCNRKRDLSRQKLAERWIHAIPLLVVLVFLILWWFSSPVNLENNNGIAAKAYSTELPRPLNYTHIELAIVGATAMQIASVPLNLTSNDTKAYQVR